MTDNIIQFPGETVAEMPVDFVLDKVKEARADVAFVMTDGPNGEQFFTSTPDVATVILMCVRALHFFNKKMDEARE